MKRPDIASLLGRSRAYRTLAVAGAALALVASGMGLQHLIERQDPAPVASSVAADQQAGGPQAGDPQAGSQAGSQVGGDIAQAGAASPALGIPGSDQVAAAVGAEPPPLAPNDNLSAAAIAVHIPRLNINQALVGLQVQADQVLGAPTQFSDIGWWSDGPRPGAQGATIIAGHVTSRAGPAVFARLKDLVEGDLVVVDRADKTSATFKVVGKTTYPRTNYPDQVVYRTDGKPSVHLITCDGTFDSALGKYPDNLVVSADLVSTGPTG